MTLLIAFSHSVLFLLSLSQWLWPAACTPLRSQREALKIGSQNNQQYVQDIMRLSKAAEMHNYMNESMDPCHNFYTFACGNWAKINPANSVEHLTTGFFEVLSKAIDRKVAQLLNSEKELTNSTETDKKVNDFFQSCMKIRDLSALKYRVKLYDIILEFGEMPALSDNSWNETAFDWVETVAKIAHKYGKDIIIGMDVLPDFAENTVNRIYMGHQDFPLESRSMYLDPVTEIYRTAYKSKVKSELKKFLGMTEPLATKTADEIVEFEKDLARGLVDDKLGLGIDEMSEITTVDELHLKYAPTIDMKKLFNITLGEELNDPVYEFVEEYQKNLVDVMLRTPKKIVANYIFYTLLYDFLLSAEKSKNKQEKVCIAKTKKHFAKNLDNMVYRMYNTKETERDIDLIWDELKSTFRSELQSNKLDWIELQTRQYAVEKLDAMKLEINSYANSNFSEEFDDMVITKDDYIENVKNILELGSNQLLEELHEPPQPLEAGELLSYTPANIILENVIKVPVSLLQPYYLWATSYPNALKFGTLGSLIGHELIHGFDDSGRKFDKNGNNHDWWDESSKDAFVNRMECFSEQYSNYKYGGRYLPKSVSQSENIADNGGVRLAYSAYLKWYEEAVRSGNSLAFETLPTLNYTSKQLFFISFAQVWCSDAHPRVRDLQTSTDQHVPGKFRVIGSISNFPEFAKEFHCTKGTRMNPQEKCEIY